MNLNNLDLNKLVIFSKVVEAGNYRLASEALNVTPSALSQSISSLENSIGISLFRRLGRRLVLTDQGEMVQREFQKHHLALLASLERVGGHDNQISGLIHVGAYLEFAKFQLAPILTSFQKRHPGVQVKLVFDRPSRLHRMLEAGSLDICFSIYPERESKLIQSKPIFREELTLVSPANLLSENPTFSDLMSTPMIEYYFNHQPIRRWLWLHYKKKPKTLPVRTFAATAEMVLTLVQEGLGVGVVPEYLVRNKAAAGLTICRPTQRHLLDHIWMLQMRSKKVSPALVAFNLEVERVLTKAGPMGL